MSANTIRRIVLQSDQPPLPSAKRPAVAAIGAGADASSGRRGDGQVVNAQYDLEASRRMHRVPMREPVHIARVFDSEQVWFATASAAAVRYGPCSVLYDRTAIGKFVHEIMAGVPDDGASLSDQRAWGDMARAQLQRARLGDDYLLPDVCQFAERVAGGVGERYTDAIVYNTRGVREADLPHDGLAFYVHSAAFPDILEACVHARTRTVLEALLYDMRRGPDPPFLAHLDKSECHTGRVCDYAPYNFADSRCVGRWSTRAEEYVCAEVGGCAVTTAADVSVADRRSATGQRERDSLSYPDGGEKSEHNGDANHSSEDEDDSAPVLLPAWVRVSVQFSRRLIQATAAAMNAAERGMCARGMEKARVLTLLNVSGRAESLGERFIAYVRAGAMDALIAVTVNFYAEQPVVGGRAMRTSATLAHEAQAANDALIALRRQMCNAAGCRCLAGARGIARSVREYLRDGAW